MKNDVHSEIPRMENNINICYIRVDRAEAKLAKSWVCPTLTETREATSVEAQTSPLNLTDFTSNLPQHPMTLATGDANFDGSDDIAEQIGKRKQRPFPGNGNREIEKRREGDAILAGDRLATLRHGSGWRERRRGKGSRQTRGKQKHYRW